MCLQQANKDSKGGIYLHRWKPAALLCLIECSAHGHLMGALTYRGRGEEGEPCELLQGRTFLEGIVCYCQRSCAFLIGLQGPPVEVYLNTCLCTGLSRGGGRHKVLGHLGPPATGQVMWLAFISCLAWVCRVCGGEQRESLSGSPWEFSAILFI